MRLPAVIVSMLAVSLGIASAQQMPDGGADTSVAHPAFPQDNGPVVGIDSAHSNFHTIAGRYGPFAALLRHDGFRVVDFKSPFTAESLAAVKILVISNALPASMGDHWALPPSSAFATSEIEAIKAWVMGGGSLLLIADHKPFAGSARDFAASFGFQFDDGVVERDPIDGRRDIFTRADGTLKDDVITRGRDGSENISSVETFTGSSFKAPASARPIIVLPAGYMSHQCILPCPAGVPEHDVGGALQGAVMDVGRGRIAVFGEAAMFSAQTIKTSGPPLHFGFTAPGAEQNRQFILNLMRWLAGVLPD
jgi:hypothetical protein